MNANRRRLVEPLRALGLATVAALALTGASPPQAPAAPAAPSGCTGPESGVWLNVVVEGVRNSTGLVAITLYEDNPKKFLVRHGSLYVGRVDAREGTTRGCIFVPKAGVYALALYHDENADQGFDRNSIGLPAEGFGFSNNPPTLAGLPTFKSVRLNVAKTNLTTRVEMRYP